MPTKPSSKRTEPTKAVIARPGKNGLIHVASPARVSEFRKTYRVSKSRLKHLLELLKAEGVRV
jgi:hypothetical protein